MPTPPFQTPKGKANDFYFSVKIFSCTSSQVRHSRRALVSFLLLRLGFVLLEQCNGM